ncbi:hypothetical protein LTR84_013177 [Exophiala bonariae]|uniref:Uncharacterized protein n=1 Tax=Exophiala bonariae TaxID=1690606 RepID=A0AAV9NE15_9EURO|nr:hypothetical protein LTR84_013177 [Exophiala bonariae]
MSDYLPSFIVEPVLRQARRISRLSTGEESPGFLPTVPDLQRWNPTRFWNTSPPPELPELSAPEAERTETTVQSIARSIQLWASQLNSFDSVPSPPLEAMDSHNVPPPLLDLDSSAVTEFPPLEPDVVPPARPVVLPNHRTDSDTSLNPANDLPYRSRVHADSGRSHSSSDPRTSGLSSVTQHLDPSPVRDSVGDHSRRRDGSGALPEDDGMGPVRQRINGVWAGPGTPAEKSRLIHVIMMERYQNSQPPQPRKASLGRLRDMPNRPTSPSSILSGSAHDVDYNVRPEDLIPTYAPLDLEVAHDGVEHSAESATPDLGCVHYKRNIKMQCNTCQQWYTCRLCHDESETHTLPRRETKHMLCMLCGTPQKASQFCKSCEVQAACYYCSVCKLWNNDPGKAIYHCDDCGICRLGEGLGKDFFHCKTCAACMSIQAESTHKCIERSTKCDCPICGEYMFTSNKPVAFMRCGHGIHESCFAEWCNTSYKCPICSKSIANMESQFRRLDRHIEDQPMPEEYRDNRAYIFCNDCNSRSITRYHWLGLKCANCESYNTTQLELLGAEQTPELQQEAERAHHAGVSEASLTASQTHTPTGELVQSVETGPTTGTVAQPVPNVAGSVPRSPTTFSPWLLPHSPTGRSARSMSPVVGSYFGTSSRTPEPVRRETAPPEDGGDLDFWGRPNSPSPNMDMEDEWDSEESSSEDEAMEEDGDEEDEDEMDLIGHR